MAHRIDNHPIKDKFAGVSFSFYTEDEIKKLSVQQIMDPVAFNHLNNPNPGGLHDKKLGVSPFDHKSQCPTCGMSVNQCPGHVGHIELTAPVYNPFLFKDTYKLLKSKCFACHRIRIAPSKIEAFVVALKLLKAGDIVASKELKSYMLHAAREIALLPASALMDSKKLSQFKSSIEKLGNFKIKVDQIDLPNFFAKMDNSLNDKKADYEAELKAHFEDVTEGNVTFVSTSTQQRAILDLHKEVWASVITTSCPHCKHKSPAVKKDGYTKLFVKPLAGQAALAQKQSQILQTRGRISSTGAISVERASESGFDVVTNASTGVAPSDRKQSDVAQSVATDRDLEDLDEENLMGADSSDDEEYREGTPQKYITPIEVQDHIKRIWAKEYALLSLLYGRFEPNCETNSYSLGTEMFFVRNVVVPPTRFRPESEGGMGQSHQGDKAYLHAHSAMLTKVIQANIQLSEALLNIKLANQEDKPQNPTQKWIMLQDAINVFMDSSMAQKSSDKQQQGVRQLLERKEGMFRMKMMGKRVNFGGRSVISPDPMIKTDQIGVPVFMALKLTFPEPVAAINAAKLSLLVRNGAHTFPGANIIEDEDTGKQLLLAHMTDEEREGVSKQLQVGRKVVHRHLQTGDVLLVNRQPTLHKPSIMAHYARVLPKEQTIRMHYANCSTYNADFDGDEMNIHLPQSYQAASEALNLMATHKQYVVPTSGKPIRGLIQDSVVAGVFLSSKDTFLTKEEYMQLVYVGLRELLEDGKLKRIHTQKPQIVKPSRLWTGKQVISTVLKNIVVAGLSHKNAKHFKQTSGLSFDSKSKLPAKEWGPLGKEEGEVIVRNNVHLCGTLDKNQFGASDQGLVHCFYELYGSEKAGELLTALARIFVVFLQTHGHSCGLDDLVLKPRFNKHRRTSIEQGHQSGLLAAVNFCQMSQFNIQKLNYSNRVVNQSKHNFDPEVQELTDMALPNDPFSLDKKCIQATDPIRACLEEKIGQSSSNKEQIEAELDATMKSTMGKATSAILKDCIPEGLIKRFPKNNISAMVLTGAKGSSVNQTQISALLGQQELEGRRVPRMQNGKTLPCYLAYDPNPRASGYVSDRFISGLRPQDFFFHCMAGREGLIDTAVKTSRSGYLQRCLIKQLESLVVSYDMTVRDNDGSIVQFMYGDDGIDVMETKYLNKFRFMERNQSTLQRRLNQFLKAGAVEIESIPKQRKTIAREAKHLMKASKAISKEEALQKATGDPLLSQFHPQRHFGSISEAMYDELQTFIDKDSQSAKVNEVETLRPKLKYPPPEPEQLKQMYYWKYLRSLVHAGENVGTIAAQSIGEPSTQMTLNTFHLAGHGAANMTLGIPRLKEILMTTPSNIKTPCMTIFFNKEADLSLQQMQQITNSYERLKFSDVVQQVKMGQSLVRGTDGTCNRLYKLTLVFEDFQKLKQKLGLNFATLCKVFGDKFVPLLMTETLKELRRSAELDLAGPSKNTKDLKKVISKTTKATKVSKYAKAGDSDGNNDDTKNPEDIDGKRPAIGSEGDSEEEDRHREAENIHMDIDGRQKKKQTAYENSDSEMEGITQQKPDDGAGDSEASDGVLVAEKPEKSKVHHKSVFNEKYAKFLQYLHGDFEFVENESATVTLQFPLEFKKLLLLTLAETVLKKVLIRFVSGIEKCSLVQPQKEGQQPYLFVQGLSFEAFEKFPQFFDLERLQTNHSHAMIARYGIEACRSNIVKEIKAVFDVYGIAVDYRHLSLIGDFVTFNGEYRAFNRIGMEESVSPFLKMSYETTMKYLISSSISNATDLMSSPSSALVLGQCPAVGSNVFDLIQDSPISVSETA